MRLIFNYDTQINCWWQQNNTKHKNNELKDTLILYRVISLLFISIFFFKYLSFWISDLLYNMTSLKFFGSSVILVLLLNAVGWCYSVATSLLASAIGCVSCVNISIPSYSSLSLYTVYLSSRRFLRIIRPYFSLMLYERSLIYFITVYFNYSFPF